MPGVARASQISTRLKTVDYYWCWGSRPIRCLFTSCYLPNLARRMTLNGFSGKCCLVTSEMWIKWMIFLIEVLFCRFCANMDNLVRYSKELNRTIQTAGIGWKACQRRNRVPSRSFSTLNRSETSYPVKSNRLLIKNGPTVTTNWKHYHPWRTGCNDSKLQQGDYIHCCNKVEIIVSKLHIMSQHSNRPCKNCTANSMCNNDMLQCPCNQHKMASICTLKSQSGSSLHNRCTTKTAMLWYSPSQPRTLNMV